MEKDAETVDQLMKQLGFKTYDVMGWSDGGITGIIFINFIGYFKLRNFEL